MRVELEVNEEQFKELVEKELKDLPKEAIQTILIESIKSYLHHEDIKEIQEEKYPDGSIKEPAKIIHKDNYDNLNAFLIREESNWGGGSYNTQPSDLFSDMLKQCDFSGLQNIVDDMIKDLKENYHNILVEAISKRIADSFINDYNFTSEITDIVRFNLNKK